MEVVALASFFERPALNAFDEKATPLRDLAGGVVIEQVSYLQPAKTPRTERPTRHQPDRGS
jgi:hypothetical protein